MFRSTKLILAGLSLSSLVFASPVMAGPTSQPSDAPGQHQGPPGGGRGDRSKMVQQQLDQLNLTDDQKAKIEPIMTKLKDDMKAIMNDQSLQQDDKKTKAKDTMTAAWKEIQAVLTPDQVAQLKKLQEQRKGDRPGGQGGGKGDKGKGGKAGGDAPAPPAGN